MADSNAVVRFEMQMGNGQRFGFEADKAHVVIENGRIRAMLEAPIGDTMAAAVLGTAREAEGQSSTAQDTLMGEVLRIAAAAWEEGR